MAFAVLESTTISAFNTGTSHVADFPATVNAGDLLLLYAMFNGQGDTRDVNATPTDFTELQASTTFSDAGLYIAGKVAAGTEDGGTIDVTLNTSMSMVVIIRRYSGWFGTLATGVNVGTAAGDGAGSTAPNPPSLDPASWATEDTTWEVPMCAASYVADGAQDITAWSSGFPHPAE